MIKNMDGMSIFMSFDRYNMNSFDKKTIEVTV